MSTVRDALLARASDDRPALLAGAERWSWREYVGQCARRAHVLAELLADDRPPHVGLLMDNTPEMAFQLGAAGLGGHVAVGLNTTRRGESLLADIRKADCQVIVADPRLLPLLEGIDLAGVRLERSDDPSWQQRVDAAPDLAPEAAPEPGSLFMLIFTSGTSGDPKAVRITHEKVTFPGAYLVERLGLGADDVFYASMPLFHSNAVMAGWGPALVCGGCVALAERFSASGFLSDVRRYGATYMNYVGKPLSYVLATPARPDDADNPLRLAFGNEAGDRDIAAFSRALRVPRGRRLRLDRERRRDLTRRRARHPDRSACRSRAWPCSTPRPRRSAHGRCSTTAAGWPTSTRRPASWSTRPAPDSSPATTTTRRRRRSGCAAACTGVATSPTATRPASSTTRAARPTGCGSTARTSRPPRSSASSCGTRRSPRLRCTPYPTRRRGDQLVAALVLVGSLDTGGARGVPRRAAGPRPQAVAAARPDPRRTPPHGDQQGAQAGPPGRRAQRGSTWERAERGTSYLA